MGEEPLHDPALGQHDEAAHVVTALDDRQDQGEDGEAVFDEAVGVAAVGPDQGQPLVRGGDPGEQDVGGGAVADVRRGDHHPQQQAEGVGHYVVLAAVDQLATVDQLAAVEAPAVGADDGVRLDRRGVDHARTRLRLPTRLLPDLPTQPVVELADQTVVAPAAEEPVDPVGGKPAGIARHFVPVADQVADRVQHRAVAVGLRLSTPASQPGRHRQQRPHRRPLGVGHVRRVAALARPVVAGVPEPVSEAVTREGGRSGPYLREGVELRQQGILGCLLA